MTLHEALQTLWQQLESIADKHTEVFDTETREEIAATLYYHFVRGHPLAREPKSYGMYSREGDRKVAEAVNAFLRNAPGEPSSPPEARLTALQDLAVTSPCGLTYDAFIGHSDSLPEDLPLSEERYLEKPEVPPPPPPAPPRPWWRFWQR